MKKHSSVYYFKISITLTIIAILCMFLPYMEIAMGVHTAAYYLIPHIDEPAGIHLIVAYVLCLISAILMIYLASPKVAVSIEKEKKIVVTAGILNIIAILLFVLSQYIFGWSNPYDLYGPYHTGFYITIDLLISSTILLAFGLKQDL